VLLWLLFNSKATITYICQFYFKIYCCAAAAAEAVDNYQKLAMVLDKRPNPNRRGAGKVEQELGQSAKQLAINFPPLFSTQRKQKVEAPPRWAPLENISIHM